MWTFYTTGVPFAMCVILLLSLLLLLNSIIIHSLSNINYICSEIVINDICAKIRMFTGLHAICPHDPMFSWYAATLKDYVIRQPLLFVGKAIQRKLVYEQVPSIRVIVDSIFSGVLCTTHNDVNKPCTQWYIHADKEVGLKKDIHEHFRRTSRMFSNI